MRPCRLLLACSFLVLAPKLAWSKCSPVSIGGPDLAIKMQRLKPADGMPDARDSDLLIIGDQLRIPITYAVTSKGNGTVEIANLQLRLYRAHADQFVYRDKALQLNLIDSGSGFCDLVVSGIIDFLNDAGQVIRQEPAVEIYRYQDNAGVFAQSYSRTPVPIALRK